MVAGAPVDLNETHDDELHDDDFNVMETLNEVDDDDDDMEEYRFDRSTKIHRQSLLCTVSICHLSVSHCVTPCLPRLSVTPSPNLCHTSQLHDVHYEWCN